MCYTSKEQVLEIMQEDHDRHADYPNMVDNPPDDYPGLEKKDDEDDDY